MICDVIAGHGERDFNAVSHKPTRALIQFNSICSRQLWFMGYGIKISSPRPPQWRHRSPGCVSCILSVTCTLGVPAQYPLPPAVCYFPLSVFSVLYAPAVSCVCRFHIPPYVPYVLCVPCIPLVSVECLVIQKSALSPVSLA